MRMLEKASPRVKVLSIGKTEEGREMIAVAIASRAIMAKLDENRARLAQARRPAHDRLDDAQAERAGRARRRRSTTSPATIHSPETGSPTALMELAYRLAVDESAVHPDDPRQPDHADHAGGRGRRPRPAWWTSTSGTSRTRARTGRACVYWGKYVAHDNNRDAMGVTLKLTENVLEHLHRPWQPQVLHDLHESVPYLYDNTVGDGPYNAWIDPILADEWQMIGWNNVVGDDEVRDAGRLHARQLRHLVARLPDVHRRDAQRHQPAVRDVRQRRRRHRRADAAAAASTRAPGTSRTRRCRRRCGRSGTTTTTSRPGC